MTNPANQPRNEAARARQNAQRMTDQANRHHREAVPGYAEQRRRRQVGHFDRSVPGGRPPPPEPRPARLRIVVALVVALLASGALIWIILANR
ncbi:hypothetical protein AB0J86_23340 [Micromonospora sp. NPDC049559]|uniref:hypothetical protein n=1 Tax=Micromonospora sp. NPDC049559 TaxID=3155923 RepID=UPI00341B8EEF